MSLGEYQEKREFTRTSEPAGSVEEASGPLRFVVQKHHASRLHYDLRLEMMGVLKSWAVPKGPSLNPVQRHLAVMVEDHPLDYISFEGVIPEGNYGAGEVMVWDQGEYCTVDSCERKAEEETLAGLLEKGHITFILKGQKLKGKFMLVRMEKSKEGNEWLLFKSDDEFATGEDILLEDRSVVSGRTIEEIASGESEKPLTLPNLDDAPESPMPHEISPMLATLVDEPFDKSGWLFELKWDGYRAIAEIEGEKVRLYSRNQQAFNERFPPVVLSLAGTNLHVVLDGEIVVLDEQGRPRFQLLQNYLRTKSGNLAYYVFDILYLEGHDLRKLPLLRRKEILRSVLAFFPKVKFSDYLMEQGTGLFRLSCERGVEGVVGKKAASVYQDGVRSSDWLKVRCMHRQEFVIGGYTEPRGSRRHLGALALGVFEGGDLIYAGNAGSGLDEKSIKYTWERLQPLETTIPPFKDPPKTSMPIHWVKPELVCEVRFHGWTDDGLLRQPVILGLREDKLASEVRHEEPVAAPAHRGKFAEKPAGKEEKDVEIGARLLKLTNLSKVFWPEDRYTKGDLVAYYQDAATLILPYLKDRPESMNRFPDGIEGESFYQKNVVTGMVPDWVETVRVESEESKEGVINYLLCQDEAALVLLANMACIELNPWNSRVGSLERPDYAVLDLDPLDVGWPDVIKTAAAARDILEKAEIPSYPKTSGATGLHVYIPLGAKYSYEQARTFIEILARLINRRIPDITSIERSPARRKGRVYLDYLQNVQGKTLASVYCVRPQPHAPVSTPLRWNELESVKDPSEFNIRTVRGRFDSVGDLFKDVLGEGIDLAEALERLSKI
ncbi:MAG TPA: DNA ligase D [Armatimonadota bacterium]|jgi:bifunctional non-homologous end joining protein LigD